MEHPDSAQNEQTGSAHDRRRGPRRVAGESVIDVDRRRSDRRKRRPGLAALFGAIFGSSSQS